MYENSIQITEEQKSAIPDPKGYKLLIAIPQVEEKTKGGIYIPDQLKASETVASVVGYVVAMGDLAYKDEKKFGKKPWCEVGDYVIIRSYSGTRLRVGDQEFRLINDDTVEAVVEDPRSIVRAI
jgi:co-chaperonin GroES (HSP10)